MDGDSPHVVGGRLKRIGIRSPNVLHDTLARHGEAFCRIRTPSICQVKAFDGMPAVTNWRMGWASYASVAPSTTLHERLHSTVTPLRVTCSSSQGLWAA